MRLFSRQREADLEVLGRLKEHGCSSSTVDVLGRFIAQAADRELFHANPRYWAERLGLDERTVLTLIISAAAEGLFDLHWQTACPRCKSNGRVTQSLGGMTGVHRCEQCEHEYEPHLDDEIHIAVSVKETLRRLAPKNRDDLAFRASIDARYGSVPALALINVPAFRQLVSRQLLPEGQYLGVKRLAIFFSDLRGSTALYHRLGDAVAYHWVCEHFKVMFEAAGRHNGTAVKTIGDGVMGVFANPLDALSSIADVSAGLAALNERAGFLGDDRLILKVGLHVGACIVVTLNGRLDYFGETVNIASRLSGLAQGNDMILSPAIFDEPAACGFATSLGQILPLTVKLRGLPESHNVHRLVFS